MDILLPESPPLDRKEVQAALDVVFEWSYDDDVEELRSLYVKGLDLQWRAFQNLDWRSEFDRDAFAQSFAMGGVPLTVTRFWRSLPKETQWEVSRRTALFSLSNFLHGEQGALLVAGQMISAVPDMAAKFYSATQALDEARHVEVFSAYIRKLGGIEPITPALDNLLDRALQSSDWKHKAVAMQVVVEGLALYSFRDMRNATREPLFKQLLTYVARDEARHAAFGITYLSREVRRLPEHEAAELEDFAFESARTLLDSQNGPSMRKAVFDIWEQCGVPAVEVVAAMLKEADTIKSVMTRTGARQGPVMGFIIPTLKTCGLLSERVQAHYEQLFDSVRIRKQGVAAKKLSERVMDLPSDLLAWVNFEA